MPGPTCAQCGKVAIVNGVIQPYRDGLCWKCRDERAARETHGPQHPVPSFVGVSVPTPTVSVEPLFPFDAPVDGMQ